jgi:hypothetical protein
MAMASKTRVLLEVGSYSSPQNYSVIGDPTNFYIWHKLPNAKGGASDWFKGSDAFRHFNKMRELLLINKDEEAFISYLSDLFYTKVPTL